MKTIWKFELQPTVAFSMPGGAEILCVQNQNGLPQLWALVDPEVKAELRGFTCYGTGHAVPDNPGRYIGTVQMHAGELIFHVFEDLAEEGKPE